jgi:endonuclease III
VLEALWELGAGDQISRMIVSALRDCGLVVGETSDVKGDVYVSRVLGRSLRGRQVDAETAVELARQIYPADPWQLDAVLWRIGNAFCHAKSPDCSAGCPLTARCDYAAEANFR